MPYVMTLTNEGEIVEIIDANEYDLDRPLSLAEFIDRIRWAVRAALNREQS